MSVWKVFICFVFLLFHAYGRGESVEDQTQGLVH